MISLAFSYTDAPYLVQTTQIKCFGNGHRYIMRNRLSILYILVKIIKHTFLLIETNIKILTADNICIEMFVSL